MAMQGYRSAQDSLQAPHSQCLGPETHTLMHTHSHEYRCRTDLCTHALIHTDMHFCVQPYMNTWKHTYTCVHTQTHNTLNTHKDIRMHFIWHISLFIQIIELQLENEVFFPQCLLRLLEPSSQSLRKNVSQFPKERRGMFVCLRASTGFSCLIICDIISRKSTYCSLFYLTFLSIQL